MTHSWYLLATKPVHRLEFDVMHALNQQERAAMVPFEETHIKRKDKRFPQRVKIPLYPRYVFVQLPANGIEREHHALKAIEIRREYKLIDGAILGLVSSSKERFSPYRLPDDAVEFIKELSESGWRKMPKAKTVGFRVGANVRVADGPFKGFGAKVDSVARDRIRVMLHIFGTMNVVDMDPADLVAA